MNISQDGQKLYKSNGCFDLGFQKPQVIKEVHA